MFFDFAVIGAGVVGGFVARELTKYRGSVVMLEKEHDVAMGATKANSAIVHAGFDAHEGTLKARLNVRGSEMMEDVAGELGVKYKRNGSLVVGFSEDDRRTLLSLLERGKKNGVHGLRIVERDELEAMEPNIGHGVTCALLAPTGAIICPYELCIAAVGNAMDNGAGLELNFEVSSIEKNEDGTFTLTAKDGRTVTAGTVINCAGVYSDEVAAMAGDRRFTVHPRKGEYMLLDKDCGSLVSHTIFRCPSEKGKGVLVTTTVDGNLLLGPTAEDIEDKTDTSTTAAGLAFIREKASEQAEHIPFGKVITSFAGLRSVGSTGDFIIDMPTEGFVNAAAIESPGLSSSPAIAEYIADLLQNTGRLPGKNPDFDGHRAPTHYFRALSDDEKNDIIKKNPAFAHVICRCETVTEGEITEAIHRKPYPTDVDGVKRRTRSTMGRCQGGFCTPYIAEILARELGEEYGDITKCGGDSYLNVSETKQSGGNRT